MKLKKNIQPASKRYKQTRQNTHTTFGINTPLQCRIYRVSNVRLPPLLPLVPLGISPKIPGTGLRLTSVQVWSSETVRSERYVHFLLLTAGVKVGT